MVTDSKLSTRKKIGELLLEQGLINRELLKEALGYQKQYGGFIGDYLVKHGYVSEKDIVLCICRQYGFPYIDISSFTIDKKIINLVPASISEKFCLIPIDKIGSLITIAMVNPLNYEAIQAVKLATGCEVQIFIATISDIKNALETYYGIRISEELSNDIEPNIIDVKIYKGVERRRFFRFKANIDVHFAHQDSYVRKETKDISAGGVCFYSPNELPLNSYLTLEIELPKNASARPIASVVKVVRILEIEHKKRYEIGAVFVQLDPVDRVTIIKYAKDCELER